MSEGKPAPAPPRFARRRPRGDEPEERDEEIHRGESRGEPLPEGLRRPPDKGGDESKERRVHARQEREDEDDREAREKPRPRVDGGEPPEAGRLHQASFFPASSRPRRRFEKMAATPKRPKIQPMPPTTSLTLIDGSSASASVRFIGLSWRWSALSTISSTSAGERTGRSRCSSGLGSRSGRGHSRSSGSVRGFRGGGGVRRDFIGLDGPRVSMALARADLDDEAVARLREALRQAEGILALVVGGALVDDGARLLILDGDAARAHEGAARELALGVDLVAVDPGEHVDAVGHGRCGGHERGRDERAHD